VHNLPRVIGPAPSELEQVDLMERLTRERSRVRGALYRFRESPTPTLPKSGNKAKARGKTRQPSKIAMSKKNLALMQEAGLTLEQLEAFIQKGGV